MRAVGRPEPILSRECCNLAAKRLGNSALDAHHQDPLAAGSTILLPRGMSSRPSRFHRLDVAVMEPWLGFPILQGVWGRTVASTAQNLAQNLRVLPPAQPQSLSNRWCPYSYFRGHRNSGQKKEEKKKRWPPAKHTPTFPHPPSSGHWGSMTGQSSVRYLIIKPIYWVVPARTGLQLLQGHATDTPLANHLAARLLLHRHTRGRACKEQRWETPVEMRTGMRCGVRGINSYGNPVSRYDGIEKAKGGREGGGK